MQRIVLDTVETCGRWLLTRSVYYERVDCITI